MTDPLDYDLTPESVVWDVGTYKGEFACSILRRYNCRIVCFEPMRIYLDALERKLRVLTKRFEIRPYGLLDKDLETEIPLGGDRSTLYHDLIPQQDEMGGPMMAAAFKDVAQEVNGQVDLAKINIEGAEYPLLQRLLSTGKIEQFRHLMIQFHPFYPGAEALYEQIAADLNQTHRLSWREPWVWESWQRREEK